MAIENLKAGILETFISELFKRAGVASLNSKQVADGLVSTSLRGVDSHGIRLAPHYIKEILAGRINPKAKLAFKKTAPSAGILNAGHSLGMVAGIKAIDQAMAMAKKNGIAAVAVNNSTHFGAAAVYALRAANKGFLALVFTNTESLVVPFGGRQPVLGTNPICFAAPCQAEEPFCLDMATTNISWNKLQMLKSAKGAIAQGWAVDKFGKVTQDFKTAEFLTHFGNYKGYGLSLMVEILCSLLSGGSFGPKLVPMVPINKNKRELSHFFIAIDPKVFGGLKNFSQRLKILLNSLRRTKTATGFKKVLVAGDPEKAEFKMRSQKGIPVSGELKNEFNELAEKLKLSRNL